jgi:hypothetical protein
VNAALTEALFRAAFGAAGVFNGATTYGHLDVADEVMLDSAGYDGGVTDGVLIYRFATGRLPGLRTNSEMTVDGNAYRVWKLMREQDGGVSAAYLIDPD